MSNMIAFGSLAWLERRRSCLALHMVNANLAGRFLLRGQPKLRAWCGDLGVDDPLGLLEILDLCF